MGTWDDEFREPTQDEQSARRILALAVAFINAHRPLNMTEIHREFYPNMTDATFRKTFLRDRERLAAAGLALCNGPKVDDVLTWRVDEESSFARENMLTQEDAIVLDCLLLPLASDPSFPYARDLRLALTKIDRSFDGTSQAAIPPEARRRNNNISRMEDCMSSGHAAKVTYKKSDGTVITRVLAPYGFFFLHESTYMVAARAGSDAVEGEPPHTYNLDRVLSAREMPRIGFVRPADFDIRDFINLPFQMGPARYEATFELADGTRVVEEVNDEDVAVSWAIAKGATPRSPESLVSSWKLCLSNLAEGEDLS